MDIMRVLINFELGWLEFLSMYDTSSTGLILQNHKHCSTNKMHGQNGQITSSLALLLLKISLSCL